MDAVRHPLRKIKSENNGDSEQISTHNFILGERICRLCLGAKANTNIFEMESEMVAKILLNLIVCCDLEVSFVNNCQIGDLFSIYVNINKI